MKLSAIQSTLASINGVIKNATLGVLHSVATGEIMEWERCSVTGLQALTLWEVAHKNGKRQAGMV